MSNALPGSQPAAWPTPVMGWYSTPGGTLRWWDGQQWTGFVVKNGVPKTDWATADQPALLWVFGTLLCGLGLAGVALGAYGTVPIAALGGLLIAMAVQVSSVRRMPTPTTGPVVLDAIRPLPGEQEAPGAGWLLVANHTWRWWTGARWSQYSGTRLGVRPSFHGAKAYRRLRLLVWGILGSGIAIVIVGIVMTAVITSRDPADLDALLGMLLVVVGVIIAILGAALLATLRPQRRALLVPIGPPEDLDLRRA